MTSYVSKYFSRFGDAFFNYYHPMMRNDSIVPLVHLCCASAAVGYTCNYVGKRYEPVQERRAIQKLALKEYYEKHGGDAGHH